MKDTGVLLSTQFPDVCFATYNLKKLCGNQHRVLSLVLLIIYSQPQMMKEKDKITQSWNKLNKYKGTFKCTWKTFIIFSCSFPINFSNYPDIQYSFVENSLYCPCVLNSSESVIIRPMDLYQSHAVRTKLGCLQEGLAAPTLLQTQWM